MHYETGHTGENGLRTDTRSQRNKRMPRTARVVFEGIDNAIHCQIRKFSENSAILTMGGWIGFPQEFSLYVEPDRVHARCKVLKRRGSTVEVTFAEVEQGVRFRNRQPSV